MSEAVDREVRRVVYEIAMRSGKPPLVRHIADALTLPEAEVVASLRRLAEAHVLVLQRDGDEVLMAAPWSAVPTPFVVDVAGVRAYANCMWDALGISAVLERDAEITTSCPDCGTAAALSVKSGTVVGEGLVHFALPARQWWNDIVFT